MNEMSLSVDFLLDWKAAELAAVAHMKVLGFLDAQLTANGADGGVDALSSDAAAQVKFYASPIGRPDVQRLRGAAHEYRMPLFYSTGGYTKEAVAYANSSGVALFRMDPYGACEPASDSAHVLIAPDRVQERRARAEELQSIQYGFALAAFNADLARYSTFGAQVDLQGAEASLFEHVQNGLTNAISRFRDLVNARDFDQAGLAFEEVQVEFSFLNWITSSDMNLSYSKLDEAIDEGWKRDATPGSAFLLQRAADQVFELKALLRSNLAEWEDHFPPGVRLSTLIDDETVRLAGMLLSASLNSAILPPALTELLITSLASGVKRGTAQARATFKQVIRLLETAKLEPRVSYGQLIRVEAIATSIDQQLKASLKNI